MKISKKADGAITDLTMVGGIALMVFGWLGALFFGISIVGYLVSPNKLENLPPMLLTVALFAGCVVLIRKGGAGLRSRRNNKNRDGETKNSTAKSIEEGQSTVVDSRYNDDTPYTCKSCGAMGVPDEAGCCEYCGTVLR